jgi:hypothetical protein
LGIYMLSEFENKLQEAFSMQDQIQESLLSIKRLWQGLSNLNGTQGEIYEETVKDLEKCFAENASKIEGILQGKNMVKLLFLLEQQNRQLLQIRKMEEKLLIQQEQLLSIEEEKITQKPLSTAEEFISIMKELEKQLYSIDQQLIVLSDQDFPEDQIADLILFRQKIENFFTEHVKNIFSRVEARTITIGSLLEQLQVLKTQRRRFWIEGEQLQKQICGQQQNKQHRQLEDREKILLDIYAKLNLIRKELDDLYVNFNYQGTIILEIEKLQAAISRKEINGELAQKELFHIEQAKQELEEKLSRQLQSDDLFSRVIPSLDRQSSGNGSNSKLNQKTSSWFSSVWNEFHAVLQYDDSRERLDEERIQEERLQEERDNQVKCRLYTLLPSPTRLQNLDLGFCGRESIIAEVSKLRGEVETLRRDLLDQDGRISVQVLVARLDRVLTKTRQLEQLLRPQCKNDNICAIS